MARAKHLDYRRDTSWPRTASWVTRRLKPAAEDLCQACVVFEERVPHGPNAKAIRFVLSG